MNLIAAHPDASSLAAPPPAAVTGDPPLLPASGVEDKPSRATAPEQDEQHEQADETKHCDSTDEAMQHETTAEPSKNAASAAAYEAVMQAGAQSRGPGSGVSALPSGPGNSDSAQAVTLPALSGVEALLAELSAAEEQAGLSSTAGQAEGLAIIEAADAHAQVGDEDPLVPYQGAAAAADIEQK